MEHAQLRDKIGHALLILLAFIILAMLGLMLLKSLSIPFAAEIYDVEKGEFRTTNIMFWMLAFAMPMIPLFFTMKMIVSFVSRRSS